MLKVSSGDVSGAVADLGVLVPLAAALILVNGIQPGPMLVAAGVLSLAAGLWFRVPWPVQPMKAMAALAVAGALSPEVIHAAGLVVGLVLAGMTLTGLAERLARAFTKPVIRSVQMAVGVLLLMTAYRLAANPPELFVHAPTDGWSIALAATTMAVVAYAAYRKWYLTGIALVVVGVAAAWGLGDPEFGPVSVLTPSLSLPPIQLWGSALVLLVIPQLPLTYGNAVVGVSDLAREQFPDATRVRPGPVALSSGLGNIASSLLGGMPMCHGSSGFTAHVRLGARSNAMNVLLGGSLILLGGVFGDQVLVVFGLLPAWGLAGFLGYAGLRHAMLVLDLSGHRLVTAVLAAILGIATGNLAYTTAAALAIEWLPRLRRARIMQVRVATADQEN